MIGVVSDLQKLTDEIVNLIEFFKETERLKVELRTAWLSNGKRESVAEHSWRMGLIALCLLNFEVGIDAAKVLKMCIIHDLGEAHEGDVSAIAKENQVQKIYRETKCMNKMLENLKSFLKHEVLQLWNEYNAGYSKESKFVHAVDKIETLIQHIQGCNPATFDYAFNLDYGREWTDQTEIFIKLRSILDSETREIICAQEQENT